MLVFPLFAIPTKITFNVSLTVISSATFSEWSNTTLSKSPSILLSESSKEAYFVVGSATRRSSTFANPLKENETDRTGGRSRPDTRVGLVSPILKVTSSSDGSDEDCETVRKTLDGHNDDGNAFFFLIFIRDFSYFFIVEKYLVCDLCLQSGAASSSSFRQ